MSQTKLARVSEELAFRVQDGPTLYNLQDLLDALLSMSNDQYVYHVNKERNDFAEWVEHVLGDKLCADSLRRARTRSGAVPVVRRSLRKLV